MKAFIVSIIAGVLWGVPVVSMGQIITGSNGSDGAFAPTSNITINMADHPTGIYQYKSVNIPSGVTVTFTPNANYTPVVWLVQGSCVINGAVSVSAESATAPPGGYSGGNAGTNPSSGQGPGAGAAGDGDSGGNGSYGSSGEHGGGAAAGGPTYGNIFILPLIGGSGGGGDTALNSAIGGAGGGAILIAAANQIQVNGDISSNGFAGQGQINPNSLLAIFGGNGSGGAIRLVSASISGNGHVSANSAENIGSVGPSGLGRIRFDCLASTFSGNTTGVFTQGFQPIIIPVSGQGIQMAVASVGGIPAPASPKGQLIAPDVTISGQQINPIPIVVSCTNLPLNTPITVTVTPANGAPVTIQGANSAGTAASSTATVLVNMPHGGGIIYAQTVTAVLTASSTSLQRGTKERSYAETGLTTEGERFTKMEITASLGGKQRVVYLTESGKRYPFPAQ
jgi:hypothetical protein